MNTIITCQLPEESKSWRPDPFPGSEEAFQRGCTCPVSQPWPGGFRFASDCPLHELVKKSRKPS